MKFNIFVINLDESKDRLDSITKQCEKLNLTFERIPAVRGSNLSIEEKNKYYSIEENKKKYHKLLSDGEIGCSLSHIKCWERIIEKQLDFALILEDDAIILDSIVDYINEIYKLDSTSWDYIKLSHGKKIKSVLNTMKLNNELSLNSCLKFPSTTTGQFISFTGANKLLENVYPICRPIDIDIQFWHEKGIRPLVAIPFPIENGDFGSDINTVSQDRRYVKKHTKLKIILKIKSIISILINRHKPTLPQKKSK